MTHRFQIRRMDVRHLVESLGISNKYVLTTTHRKRKSVWAKANLPELLVTPQQHRMIKLVCCGRTFYHEATNLCHRVFYQVVILWTNSAYNIQGHVIYRPRYTVHNNHMYIRISFRSIQTVSAQRKTLIWYSMRILRWIDFFKNGTPSPWIPMANIEPNVNPNFKQKSIMLWRWPLPSGKFSAE